MLHRSADALVRWFKVSPQGFQCHRVCVRFHIGERKIRASWGYSEVHQFVILVMVLITCGMELRRRERAEIHLLKVLDSVQTDLEKGRVRQALDTLHVEFHNMEVSE